MEADRANRSDAVLVASVATGDTGALAALYDRHADAIYRTAFRRLGDGQLAEEVLQDTFMALWNRAELFDPASGSLLAWLSTIARNRAIDRLRALGRRPAAMPLSAFSTDDESGDERGFDRAMSQGTLVGSGKSPPDPQEYAELQSTRAEVQAALIAMPALERQVIELAYYEELTQAEIAQRLGWPLGTVKTRTRRGLLRLRRALAVVLGPEIAPGSQMEAALEVAGRGGAEDFVLGEANGSIDGSR